MKVRVKEDCVLGRRYLRAGDMVDVDWPRGVTLPSALEEIGKAKSRGNEKERESGNADAAAQKVKI